MSTMQSGPFRPEGSAYNGVFIAGDDALTIAAGLRTIRDGGDTKEAEAFGMENPLDRAIRLLESCK